MTEPAPLPTTRTVRPAASVEPALRPTPSQTVGPYLHIGLTWPDGAYVVPEGTPSACWLRGRVIDGGGEVIPDALVETWQADPAGRFAHPDDPHGSGTAWRGFGRSDTTSGEYAIHTVRPGALPGPADIPQAPHLNVSVFARGLLRRVVTRVYFPEFEAANRVDPVLNSLPWQRRDTLIATATADGYRFDIRLQGDRETVFFDV
ncbi:protocatechuate 3,4-dioxygenase subunit alpha [Nocardia sp. CC227C]|uniref:protocatechuate 3,4-dioxygenase subunit alpha n=1 Tax=Nocardia sp. CC227C TaxID=3044562 RepID=UPI00278BBFDA|nr:protocatechuate 3,4-dioxygenase subunit alpha [Nocardia sp. CC227C]